MTPRAISASVGCLTRVIAHKWRVAAGVVALFIVAILGMSVVKSSFSPPPIVRKCWLKCSCLTGRRLARPAPRRRKLSTGCSGSRRRRLSPAISASAPRFYLAMAPELPDPSFAKLVVLTDGQGCPRGAQAAAAGGGGQWPGAGRRGARHSAGVWPLFALSGRLAGDGARSARSARHRRAG